MRCKTMTVVMLAVCMAGCATRIDYTNFVSSFDESTGESMSHPKAPVTLSAEQPGLSTIGRDYLAMSPVSVSGRGAPATWLWFSLGSSIDRDLAGAPEPEVESIILLVDDVPMTLTLQPWSDAATASPFDLPVREQGTFGARITDSQLRKIAGSARLEAVVISADRPSPRFSVLADNRSFWNDL